MRKRNTKIRIPYLRVLKYAQSLFTLLDMRFDDPYSPLTSYSFGGVFTSPRRRLIEHKEEGEKKEVGYVSTSTAPRSKQILRTRYGRCQQCY